MANDSISGALSTIMLRCDRKLREEIGTTNSVHAMDCEKWVLYVQRVITIWSIKNVIISWSYIGTPTP